MDMFPTIAKYSSSNAPWRFICKFVDWLNSRMKWKVNNDNSLSFWHSNWSTKGVLSKSFPRLYAFSSKQNSYVREMQNVNNKTWDIHSRRPLRDREALQWRTIQSSLPPLTDNIQKDEPIQIPSNDDSFLVKSVLQTNAPNARNPDIAASLKKLWKSQVPKKCKFFIWTATYNEIFTMEKIQRRLENLCLNPNQCVLCKKSNETTDHIFLLCPYSRNIWNTTKNQLNYDLIDDNLPVLINSICSNNIKT